MSLKPICVECQRFYRPKKNGISFIEQMPTQNGARPGAQQPSLWVPYKLWAGDLWECLGCGHQMIRSAVAPIAEQHMPEFNHLIAQYGATIKINDC